MTPRWLPPLGLLFWVVIADYLAQIPYYFVNDYFPRHTAPTLSSVALLGVTLVWFLVGYLGHRAHRRFGFWVLLTFLLVESIFYLATLASGAIVFELDNPSLIIRIVFLVGYVTGIVSLLYAVALVVFRRRYAERP